jgi:hypothetical protein
MQVAWNTRRRSTKEDRTGSILKLKPTRNPFANFISYTSRATLQPAKLVNNTKRKNYVTRGKKKNNRGEEEEGDRGIRR